MFDKMVQYVNLIKRNLEGFTFLTTVIVPHVGVSAVDSPLSVFDFLLCDDNTHVEVWFVPRSQSALKFPTGKVMFHPAKRNLRTVLYPVEDTLHVPIPQTKNNRLVRGVGPWHLFWTVCLLKLGNEVRHSWKMGKYTGKCLISSLIETCE